MLDVVNLLRRIRNNAAHSHGEFTLSAERQRLNEMLRHLGDNIPFALRDVGMAILLRMAFDNLKKSGVEMLATLGRNPFETDELKKGWPQRELDGLVARQMAEDRRLILPIWHNVTASDIVRYSPPLADTIALHSSRGISAVCADLKLRPDESPLIAARDELLSWGNAEFGQSREISDEFVDNIGVSYLTDLVRFSVVRPINLQSRPCEMSAAL
jgi:hypothetical protein